MRLHIVPARTGITWAKSGVRTFFRQPVALTGMFFMYIAMLALAAMVPLVGFALTLLLLPAATLGMVAASREAAEGRFARPSMLFAAFRAGPAHARAMLKLGAFYTGGFLLALGISALFDEGQFARAYLFGGRISRESLTTSGVQAAMWVMLLLYVPLSMLFWHAPALVFFYRISPAKSLFFSAVACVRNVGAFAVYALSWAVIFLVGGLVVGIFTTLLLVSGLLGGTDSALASGVAGGLMTGSALVLAAMFFTSLYITFVDCFVQPADPSVPDETIDIA